MTMAYSKAYGRQSIYGTDLGVQSMKQSQMSSSQYRRATITTMPRKVQIKEIVKCSESARMQSPHQEANYENSTHSTLNTVPHRYHRSRHSISTIGSTGSIPSLDIDTSSTKTRASSISSVGEEKPSNEKLQPAKNREAIQDNFWSSQDQAGTLNQQRTLAKQSDPTIKQADSSIQYSSNQTEQSPGKCNQGPQNSTTSEQVNSFPEASRGRVSEYFRSTGYDVRSYEPVLPPGLLRRSVVAESIKDLQQMPHHLAELHNSSESFNLVRGVPVSMQEANEPASEKSRRNFSFPTDKSPKKYDDCTIPDHVAGTSIDEKPIRSRVARSKAPSTKTSTRQSEPAYQEVKEESSSSVTEDPITRAPLRKSKSLGSLRSKIKTLFNGKEKDPQVTMPEAPPINSNNPGFPPHKSSKTSQRNRRSITSLSDLSHKLSEKWNPDSSHHSDEDTCSLRETDEERPAAGDVFPRNLDAHDVGAILSSIEYTESLERRLSHKDHHKKDEEKVANEEVVPASPDFDFDESKPPNSEQAVMDKSDSKSSLKSSTSQRDPKHESNCHAVKFTSQIVVYDTYSPSEYDRRPEPATCNRLTPQLAQQIKQELNSYKSSMPIHASSKDNTHFF